MNDPLTDKFLSVKSVGEIFDVSSATIRDWINDGKITAHKINGRWRIRQSEVNRLANKEHGA